MTLEGLKFRKWAISEGPQSQAVIHYVYLSCSKERWVREAHWSLVQELGMP